MLAAGVSYEAIARRVASGLLLPRPGSVFALAPLKLSELARRAAALLATGPSAVLGYLTALEHWGLLGPGRPDDPIHVIAPLGARRSLDDIVIHRTRGMRPDEIRIRHGLPVSSPARALLDSTELLTPGRLERAFDQGLVSRVMYPQHVAELLSRTRGRAGARRLRALLERETTGTTLTRSHAEEHFLALIRAAELPEPEINARIHGFEVDFLWRTQRLVVEIDGFRYHATRRAFEHDHRKDAVLRTARLGVLRYTPGQITGRGHAVVVDVARGLWAGNTQDAGLPSRAADS